MFKKMRSIKNRVLVIVLSALICTLGLTSCTNQNLIAEANQGQVSSSSSIAKTNISVEYDSDDENSSWSSSDASNIVLNGNSITSDGTGATVNGSKVTITASGTYCISGTLSDGQIIIDTEDKEAVRLVFNGVNITSSSSAPVYVKDAKKTVILLADGTENNITDGTSYILEDSESDEPNATIFSKSDLTINGSGALTVNANYNHAIYSKDELKIMSGNITVNSVADGIKGKDFVAIKNGTINIYSDGDGIQSNNDEDAQKGFIAISDGTINITSGKDAVQAETSVLVSGGTLNVTSGGGSANGVKKASGQMGGMGGVFDKNSIQKNDISDTDSVTKADPGSAPAGTAAAGESTASSASTDSDGTESTKGIKAAVDITIDGGTVNIDSADDSIHSNGSLSINGGTFKISSGDDGIHSDSTLEINGGDIAIAKSYEGIESSVITLNEGNIQITASDDGINVAGGNDGSSENGRSGQDEFSASGDCYLNINGGYILVDAGGDGLDSNGSINMTNGTVLVNGPENSGNGALDYNGSFVMTGGYLLAAGSSGMAQATSDSSTQYSVIANFDSELPADTIVYIETSDGKDILTFAPSKKYQSVVLCSPELKKDSTYNIYYGGTSTGTNKDGLYTGGTYSGGTKFQSFTVSDIVTSVGTAAGNMGMGGGMDKGGFPGGTDDAGRSPRGMRDQQNSSSSQSTEAAE
ncbi:uncharacterized protein DUF4353 [Ruminiclostridium sufflavum DSM 19573]|uniref:Uncharacterized protein DUF4353 n=1 Tax=Ruminiclostridium sufflavum DSM 19573 TaxID=1121337 RepID=A0A318XLG1_9FIRM|nr:carbohydrate-binding domain-containing protein [Ruminiclostridium sufflavum]PYG87223.1 uncharacterized protein DUF4353 [Ruminiclostridium sufflavum DSM 19573]